MPRFFQIRAKFQLFKAGCACEGYFCVDSLNSNYFPYGKVFSLVFDDVLLFFFLSRNITLILTLPESYVVPRNSILIWWPVRLARTFCHECSPDRGFFARHWQSFVNVFFFSFFFRFREKKERNWKKQDEKKYRKKGQHNYRKKESDKKHQKKIA